MSLELLAPAGSPEALDAAVGEGADSVYLGLKSFNARMRSANFTWSQFEGALRSLHRMGKKLYVTVNTVFEQREADRMYQLLKYLANTGPDAIIVQDFGVVAMARAEFPSLKIHASTQMNVASARGANALSRYGVSRVVLARELGLAELQSVRADTNVELEVFVHGALCVSASGLCLFSSYLGGKSANRGMCTQACRRLYEPATHGSAAPESGYYFSPGDLQLVERLPDLAAAGITALKIEGRMKSADYVGTVVSAYRLVLDAMNGSAINGGTINGGDDETIRQAILQGQALLRNDFARSKTSFYFDTGAADKSPAQPEWLHAAQDGGTGLGLGTICAVKGTGETRQGLIPAQTNAAPVPAAGDSVRLHRSDDSHRAAHKLKYAAPASGGESGWWISIPEGFGTGDRVYLIQTKAMSKRYQPVIAPSKARNTGGRSPGREQAPFPETTPAALPAEHGAGKAKHSRREKPDALPPGLYVAVSRTSDLYIVQSSRPARVMLTLNRANAAVLLAEDRPPLPFKPAETILTLDPYFPQADAEPLAACITRLIEKGYRHFVVNNPGHFSLFRDYRGQTLLIAGPWLYTFNAWALSFTASLGAAAFVSPLENNRQNLERTVPPGRDSLRSLVFVPVFAWPPLFHIRAGLSAVYEFDAFSDSRGEQFSLVTTPAGSQVLPEKPFSITDKIPFLQAAGFQRFIIDLSGHGLKKSDYRDIMSAAASGVPLPGISRFNWKNGFYKTEETETAVKKERL
jgi:putative protease